MRQRWRRLRPTHQGLALLLLAWLLWRVLFAVIAGLALLTLGASAWWLALRLMHWWTDRRSMAASALSTVLPAAGPAPPPSAARPSPPAELATNQGGPAIIRDRLALLPPALLARSGAVFYTGAAAFAGPADLYILGLNPGGDPLRQAAETIARDVAAWEARPARWSAYADESWEGRPPGTHGLQPRLLHLLAKLGRNPRDVPASNLLFVRSRDEAQLAAEKETLAALCWPVHQAVIQTLGVRTILCLGGTAGRWTRERLGAHRPIDRFRETNRRGWESSAHLAPDGRAVVTLTHPGRADWRHPTPIPPRSSPARWPAGARITADTLPILARQSVSRDNVEE